MFTFETVDLKEVRRFRIAQFNGRTATVASGGTTVTGHIRSIQERKSSSGQMGWSITMVPMEPRVATPVLRPISLARAFAEDHY
jgi:hypothetical protein